MTDPLWFPDPFNASQCAMSRLIASLRTQFADFSPKPDRTQGPGADDFWQLHNWAIERPEAFWSALWDFAGVSSSAKGQRVLSHLGLSSPPQWFADAQLNYAQNLLAGVDGSRTTVIFESECGHRRSLSGAELREHVLQCAAGLSALGLKPGDRAAAVAANTPETLIVALACACIGVIWSCCSPDFGATAIQRRFGQIQPKVLFYCDRYDYNGKSISCTETLSQLLPQLDTVEHAIVLPFDEPMSQKTDGLCNMTYAALLESCSNTKADFIPLAFNHPLCILFTSGTTGKPKCIVHSHGGVLLQHLKEHLMHVDLRRGERIFFYTTTGWMMWNWLISALACGGCVVLYDGAPMYPSADRLFDMAARYGLHHFGTSAGYLNALRQRDFTPKEPTSLKLRTLLSTGSPLSAKNFDYVYRELGSNIRLGSISGGTDLVGCLLHTNPLLPVHAGQLQGPGLGMDICVLDETGQRLPVGQSGELCCANAFPSMPIALFGDNEQKKLKQTYFSRFKGHWHHGDWVSMTEEGGYIVHGRSDATLNPMGVRIGTAEIYRVLADFSEVAEGLATTYRSQNQEGEEDERIVLFVKMQPRRVLDEHLQQNIRTAIRHKLSPRHVPKLMIQAPDLPHTRNGKLMELAVHHVIHRGLDVPNLNAIANPESLAFFHQNPALKEHT